MMIRNKIQEIDDLFTMFHDFEIVGIRLVNDVLTLQILLPWSQMWNVDNYIMTFEFQGCKSIKCNYHVRVSDELVQTETSRYYPTEEKFTTDPSEIVKFELDIQRHLLIKPNSFKLFCTSSSGIGIGQVESATIELTTTNYKIFDNKGQEMSLDKMKAWSSDWWQKIQKMWDEQK